MAESVTTSFGKLTEEVSADLPIPPKMIEDATAYVEKHAIEQLKQLENIAKKVDEARDQLSPIIQSLGDSEPYHNFMGIDGGIGFPSNTIGATYASVVGVAYSSIPDLEPKIKVDPIIIPSSLGAPHQNYLAMWRQKYEYMVAAEAAAASDCTFMDGTLVPSIFVRYLRSAQLYEML